MPTAPPLAALLDHAARIRPDNLAVADPDFGNVTFAELQACALAVAQTLRGAGIRPGDRVGICASKSVGVVAAIFGILYAHGAYVPVDPGAPAVRSAFIFGNCGIAALIVARDRLEALQEELRHCRCETVGTVDVRGPRGPDLLIVRCHARAGTTVADPPPGLGYILYTSGSTGVPKGVMHSHASALAFVDWCSREFAPTESDRFSSHAPFHFDLSIFDLYVAVKHCAGLVIISEERGKQPQQLAALIEDYRLTIWYSTPSILRLLVEYGKLRERDCTALRLVLYAGEVFPPKHQRALRAILSHPVYYNLYGPTETNVCTFDRVDQVPPDDHASVLPIGRVCSDDRARVVAADGGDVAAGEEGELLVAGGSVMLGYWNLPEQNARAFAVDAQGRRWYRTGDVVVDQGGGYYLFLGRRDRMVKRRGYRIELAEIEAALHRHEHVTEAAAVAVPDAENGVLIKAFVNWMAARRPSLVELKSFAARNLPAYMIPDRFTVLEALPKTSTDKVDYQKLKELA